MVESSSPRDDKPYSVTLVNITKEGKPGKKKHTVYSFNIVGESGNAW